MSSAVDAIVNERITPQGPGAAVAVILDGVVCHAKGYGLASLEWEQPVGLDTVFCIGSLTKPFTAQAILLLERAGKLRLDEPITAYLPEYPMGNRHVTLMHLLTHTSGIANYVRQPGSWEREAAHARSPAELVDLFKSLPPIFAPGERYSYSNSGYVLLGRIIEAVSGMPWEVFVRECIFAPLGMVHSSYALHEPIISRRASGYVQTAHGYENTPLFSMTLAYAAGGLCSTPADLILWDQAMREHRLLDSEPEQRMRTPLWLNNGRSEGYGLGWGISDFRGRCVVHHAGGVPGFSSFFGRFVDDDMTLIVLSNIAGFDAAGLAGAIAASALELPAPRRAALPTAAEDLKRMAGVYSDGITTLEVVYNGERLALRGEFDYQLFPTSGTTCAATADPDVELYFTDLSAAGFNRVKLVVPCYWVSAYRVRDASQL